MLQGLKLEKDSELKSIVYLCPEAIRPNPYQPRKKFDKILLDELCESIKEYGVLQPINVRKTPGNMYELVSGERRLRAAKMVGLNKIPAILVDIDDNDSAVIALIENLQREDLNYIEEAEGYHNLINDHGFTQEALALKIGKSQSTIANKIRILRLSPVIKKILSDNDLTERHARALLKLHDEQLQLKVLKLICEKGLNVRKTEELVDKAILKFSQRPNTDKKYMKPVRDVRIFVNTIKQAVDMVKKSGVKAKAAQIDKGNYFEFIIRIAK